MLFVGLIIIACTVFVAFLLSGIRRADVMRHSVWVAAIVSTVCIFLIDEKGIAFTAIGLSTCLWLLLLASLFYPQTDAETDMPRFRNFSIQNFAACVVATIIIFARAYYFDGIHECAAKAACRDMWSAVYFSTVTWTTLGYGDLSPQRDFYITAAYEALLGYLAMGLFIGLMTNKLSRLFHDD